LVEAKGSAKNRQENKKKAARRIHRAGSTRLYGYPGPYTVITVGGLRSVSTTPTKLLYFLLLYFSSRELSCSAQKLPRVASIQACLRLRLPPGLSLSTASSAAHLRHDGLCPHQLARYLHSPAVLTFTECKVADPPSQTSGRLDQRKPCIAKTAPSVLTQLYAQFMAVPRF
jgi:hypothetical protein